MLQHCISGFSVHAAHTALLAHALQVVRLNVSLDSLLVAGLLATEGAGEIVDVLHHVLVDDRVNVCA